MKKAATICLLGLSFLIIPAAGVAKVKLAVQSPYGAGPYQVAWETLAKQYMKVHPDVTVTVRAGDWGIVDQLIAASAAGTGPDISIITESYVGKLGWRGLLQDLEPWMKQSRFRTADYFKAPLDAYRTRYKGGRKQYGLPILYSGYGYTYNKDMFAKRGLVHPEDSWGYDLFREYVVKLTLDLNGDGKTDQYALDQQNHQNRMVGYIRGWGGEVVDEDKDENRFGDAASIAGLQAFDDLWAKYRAVQMDGFSSGRSAMVMNSAFAMSNYLKSKFDWDVCAAPSGPKGLKSVAMPTAGMALMANSKHKAEAWGLMQYFLSEEGQTTLGRMRISIPVHQGAAKAWLQESSAERPKHAAMFLESVKYARPSGTTPYMDDVFAAIVAKNQLAIDGKTDAAGVAKAVSPQIDAIIKKYVARMGR